MGLRTVGLGALGVFVAIAGYLAFKVHASNERFAAEKAEESRVTMRASLPSNDCQGEFPMAIDVTNGSSQTLKKIDFELSAYEPGDSRDVALGKFREWTTVLAPGESAVACYRRPAPGNGQLSIRVTPQFVGFYLPGEFIPTPASSSAEAVPQTSPERPASSARPASRGGTR